MIFRDQMIVTILIYLVCLFYIRGFIYGIKRYQLNNSAYKKRKKGESFIEWLTYSRYKEEIPKIFIILYYFVVIIHPVVIVACICIRSAELGSNLGYIFVTTLIIVDSLWMGAIALLFWSPGKDYAYKRWITKRRGQK